MDNILVFVEELMEADGDAENGWEAEYDVCYFLPFVSSCLLTTEVILLPFFRCAGIWWLIFLFSCVYSVLVFSPGS